MNTPTLPHLSLPSVSLPSVSLPSVSLPHVPVPHVGVHDVTGRVSERAGDLGELVSDAWSTSVDKVQDLAASAVGAIDDIPEKAFALAGALIPALRPTPQRSRRPFVLLAVALASIVLVAWFVKKKRRADVEPYLVGSAGASEASVSEAS